MGIILVLVLAFGRYSLKLTYQQVQTQLDAQLPKSVKGGVEVTDMTVTMGDYHLFTTIKMKGEKLGKPWNLTVSAIGVPEYQSFGGKFYFKPSQINIEHFDYDSGSLGSKLQQVSDRYVTNQGLKNALTDVSAHVDEWATTLAEKSAVAVLSRVPVYTLRDDWKGMLIQASLESLSVENDHLLVTVSAWSLTKWVTMMLLVTGIAIGVMIGLMRNPDAMRSPLFFAVP